MSISCSRYKTKKRKKVESTGIHSVLEIKQYNPLQGYAYDAIWFFPTEAMSSASNARHCYQMYDLGWPIHGTESNHRIGNNINVKAIYLKGYAELHESFYAHTMHFKLYLVRQYGVPTGENGLTSSQIWKNWEAVDQTAAVSDLIGPYRHNYFSSLVDYDHVGRSKGVVVTKVFELELKNPHIRNDAFTFAGSNSTASLWSGLLKPRYEDNLTLSYVPLDVVIRINETVDCTADRYAYIMFCDYPYGVSSYNDVVPNAGKPVPDKSVAPVALKFFTRFYFTDP